MSNLADPAAFGPLSVPQAGTDGFDFKRYMLDAIALSGGTMEIDVVVPDAAAFAQASSVLHAGDGDFSRGPVRIVQDSAQWRGES